MFTQACEPTTRKGTGAYQIEREFEFGLSLGDLWFWHPVCFSFFKDRAGFGLFRDWCWIAFHNRRHYAMLIFLLQQTTDQLRGFVKEIMHPDKHLWLRVWIQIVKWDVLKVQWQPKLLHLFLNKLSGWSCSFSKWHLFLDRCSNEED